jgi:hypothetical protein
MKTCWKAICDFFKSRACLTAERDEIEDALWDKQDEFDTFRREALTVIGALVNRSGGTATISHAELNVLPEEGFTLVVDPQEGHVVVTLKKELK